MTPCVIGYEEDEAVKRLEAMGFKVGRVTYLSRRGVEGADSARVIRQRTIGNNIIEITVSHFKTRIKDDT
ncbi:MAG: PASTA domain-containing protein [Christensenellales bacterium]|jgi:hypothetical protein